MNQLVENISDTARWVAIFRAEESERPDAVFHDPFARRLAEKKVSKLPMHRIRPARTAGPL
jgi:Leucine carboxyl methyltransferase.